MKFIFLAHLFSTLFMTGVIWFAQIVHYPLLGRVDKEPFVEYEKENTWRTGWVVIPVMSVELVTALLFLWRQPEGFLPFYAWVNASLVGVIWASTFTLQGPYHTRLTRGFDPIVHRSLVGTNWVRTAAWTIRSLLLLLRFADVLAKGGEGNTEIIGRNFFEEWIFFVYKNML